MQSSNVKKWLNEMDYVPNEYENFFIKFFKLKLEQKCLNLFSNYENIYLCQNSLKETLREQLGEILIKLCANLTSRPNKASLIIVNRNNASLPSNDKNVPIISHDWILDCVWNFKTLDIENYVIS